MKALAELLLSLENVGCARAGRMLLEGVTFDLCAGEIIQLQGPNGIGKSTLLRAIAGLLPLAGGVIRCWGGVQIAKNPDYWQEMMLYLGHADGVHEQLTPFENLAFYASCMEVGLQHVQEALSEVGLWQSADRLVKELSAGQRRRIALARLFFPTALKRLVWLLDEPFTALDAAFAARLAARIKKHAEQGGGVLLTTHQPWEGSEAVRVLDLMAFAALRPSLAGEMPR